MKIAEQTWGEVCQGEPVPVQRADIPTLGLAEFAHPPGMDGDRYRYTGCRILLRRGRISWPKFCTTVVHEVGHLAAWRARPGEEFVQTFPDGRRVPDPSHSRNPHKVMHPSYTKPFRKCGKAPAAGPAPDAGGRDPAARPTVMLLPGGGWQHVWPDTLRAWQRDFERFGYAALLVAYPAGSVIRAIEHVAAIAAGLRARGVAVIAYGISAGGTIAAALAATGEVDGAVNVVGPSDFTRWFTPGGQHIMRQLRMSAAERRAASPYWRLNGRQAPQLVQCGVADPIVTFDQCLRYAAAARRGNRDTTLTAMVNAHGQWDFLDRVQARDWVRARWPARGR